MAGGCGCGVSMRMGRRWWWLLWCSSRGEGEDGDEGGGVGWRPTSGGGDDVMRVTAGVWGSDDGDDREGGVMVGCGGEAAGGGGGAWRRVDMGIGIDPLVAFDKVFRGKVVLFGGDFRQILPVITNGGRHDVVNAMINAAYMWDKCTILRKVGGANDGQSTVVFPDDMLIPKTDDDVGAIIDDTYPDLLRNLWNLLFSKKKQSFLQPMK
ncbi:ATP-dependent DNA helicase PIF1-like protein [Tanacetum coccineum]